MNFFFSNSFLFLFKLSLAREDRRNATRLYNPIALKDLQIKFPSLDWVEYFNTLIDIQPAITGDEVIIMSNETLFIELNELLSTTPKRYEPQVIGAIS